eukprot:1160929-Pelagomonas_calceolata.AAC.5
MSGASCADFSRGTWSEAELGMLSYTDPCLQPPAQVVLLCTHVDDVLNTGNRLINIDCSFVHPAMAPHHLPLNITCHSTPCETHAWNIYVWTRAQVLPGPGQRVKISARCSSTGASIAMAKVTETAPQICVPGGAAACAAAAASWNTRRSCICATSWEMPASTNAEFRA